MKRIAYTIILLNLLFAANVAAQTKTFFQEIAGNWAGTLEYRDYQTDKSVKLNTYLTVTPSADANSAVFLTVYDDFGKIIKESETVKIDQRTNKYFAGDSEYRIETLTAGKIILRSSGQDGNSVEPIRKTIVYDNDSLSFLKETRTPWQFRNRLDLRRTTENPLAPKTLSPAEMKADLDIFKQTLTAIHPGVYRYLTPQNLEKLFAEQKAKITTPLSESEFFLIIAQIANRVRCGHTYLNPYNQNALLRERLFNRKNRLPFYFEIVDGKIVVTENAAPADLPRGAEITKINNVSAREILEKLLTVTHADGENTVAHRVRQIALDRFEAERYALFDWYFPLFFPFKNETFSIEAVDQKTKKKLKFDVPAMTRAERTTEIERRYGKSPTYDDGWKFGIRGDSVGYLKIANSITWRLKTIKFKDFLAAAFAELRRKSIKNLIVDLRGNDGGDTDVGFELAKHLAKKDLPAYIASRRLVRNVRPQLELSKYLDTYSDDLKASLKNGLPANSYQATENNFYEILPDENLESYPPISPDANNFTGKTYIISDAANASATFQFLNYAKENRLATIVGEETGGNRQGINGGNFFFLNLPNSKIEIDVPVYYSAPFKPQPDESVIPDFVVKSKLGDVAKGIDTQLSFVEKLIRENKDLK